MHHAEITNSKFVNNVGLAGGAIKVLDVGRVLLSNNMFVGNKAMDVTKKKVQMPADEHTYRGGAIFIDCSLASVVELGYEQQCDIAFSNGNNFTSNFAMVQGGAISYISVGFTDADGSTIYLNNTAGYHSDTVASYTKYFDVQTDDKSIFLGTITEALERSSS